MAEPMANAAAQGADNVTLDGGGKEPDGVLPKHMKLWVYLGASALVIVAAIFSATGLKTGSRQGAASHQASQPALQDNTQSNQQELKSDAAAAEQTMDQPGANATNSAPLNGTPAQQAAAAGYGPNGQPVPCAPGQPCAQQQQLSPAAQEEQQLAAKDRELAYEARFASNLVYTRAPDPPPQKASSPALADSGGVTGPGLSISGLQPGSSQAASSLIAPRTAGDPPAGSPTAAEQTQTQRKPEVNVDAATGQPYVLYEGTTLDTVLMNRLDGDASGPVKVLVSNPVYSHDRQHVLIPDGTIVLGEAKKIGATGFGQQRRMAVVFHRMIMPDGYSVDLDQFHGLDQAGEEGVKDKVNNHYFQIFGTSIALGVIAGAGEIEQGGGIISTNGSQAFTTGASASVSQSASTAFDRFLEIPPTITIREGHRVKVYFTQDMLLPAYENHTIPQTY